jgi:hypothetical protein
MSDYKKLYRLLEQAIFTTQSRANISSNRVYGFVLGLTKRRIAGHDGIQPSSRNDMFPRIYKQLKKMIKTRYPKFEYQAIQVNKNVTSALHRDTGNRGDSYIFAVGEFSGGELFIKSIGKKNIKNRFYKFNGSELWHKASPHRGNRYSIVFFKYKDARANGRRPP